MSTQQTSLAYQLPRITDNSQTSSLIRPPSSRSFPQRIVTQPSSLIFRYPFHSNTCFHYSSVSLLHSFSAQALEMSTQQTSLAYQLPRITDNSQTSSLIQPPSSRSTFTTDQAHEPNVRTCLPPSSVLFRDKQTKQVSPYFQLALNKLFFRRSKEPDKT